jgi:hypothetical protein
MIKDTTITILLSPIIAIGVLFFSIATILAWLLGEDFA